MKKQTAGFLLVTVTAIGLAISTILMKWVPGLTGLTPGQVAVLRFAISAPLMWVILLLRRAKSSFIPEQRWQLIGLGLIYAAASLLALFALSRLSSSLYVILVYVYPSLVVFHGLLTGQPVPRLWWVGLPLTMVGLLLAVVDFGQSLVVDFPGVILSLLNGFAIALYNIWSAKVFNKIPDHHVGTTWVNTSAMIAGLGLIPIFGVNLPDTMTGWVLLFSLGIFGTLIPILTLNHGLELIGAARGSVILTLQPVLAVLISTAFLGETLVLQQWLGGLLVVLAIILLQRCPNRKP
jgi:drug/metabolite transporter (DMT)-like permease